MSLVIRVFVVMIIAVVLLFSCCSAAHLVSDDSDDVTIDSCEFEGIDIACAINAQRGIYVDITMLPPGEYTVRARYCTQKGMWCSEWSDPLSFPRPSVDVLREIRLLK